MRVTQKYFEDFKKEFTKWQQKFGLTQYEVHFHRNTEKNFAAQIEVNEMAKMAEVGLAKSMSRDDITDGPECQAKHEAIHLLLHRMKWLGQTRYIESQDLQEEWEASVRRLEKVLE